MEAVGRQGNIDPEWWLASELVIVALALIFSAALLTGKDTWLASSPRPRGPITESRERPNHPDLQVVGMGSEVQKGVSNELQGAASIPQAGENSNGLQRTSEDNGLQPNQGQSTMPSQQKLQ